MTYCIYNSKSADILTAVSLLKNSTGRNFHFLHAENEDMMKRIIKDAEKIDSYPKFILISPVLTKSMYKFIKKLECVNFFTKIIDADCPCIDKHNDGYCSNDSRVHLVETSYISSVIRYFERNGDITDASLEKLDCPLYKALSTNNPKQIISSLINIAVRLDKIVKESLDCDCANSMIDLKSIIEQLFIEFIKTKKYGSPTINKDVLLLENMVDSSNNIIFSGKLGDNIKFSDEFKYLNASNSCTNYIRFYDILSWIYIIANSSSNIKPIYIDDSVIIPETYLKSNIKDYCKFSLFGKKYEKYLLNGKDIIYIVKKKDLREDIAIG